MEELAPMISKMLVVATVLAVLVLALTQVGITTFKIKKRFKPVLSLVLGLVLGVAAMSLVDIELPTALWLGGIAGLVASGAYDNAKTVISKYKGGNKDDSNDSN